MYSKLRPFMRLRCSIRQAAMLLCISWCVNLLHAQEASELSFRYGLASARSVALGEALVADTRDLSSAIANPASLLFLERLSVSATAGMRTDNRSLRSAVSMPIAATDRFVLAIGGEGAFFDADDWSAQKGKMAGFEASSAVRLFGAFSFGMIYDFRYTEFGATRLSSHSGGMGLMYSVLPALSYGVSFTGFGSGIQLKRAADGAPFLVKESNIPRSVTFGASWRYPATYGRKLVEVHLSNQSISGVERLVYRLGAEFFPWKFLVVRGGIVSGPVTAMGRAGIGIHTGVVDIDYGVASSTAAERLHVLSIVVPLEFP